MSRKVAMLARTSALAFLANGGVAFAEQPAGAQAQTEARLDSEARVDSADASERTDIVVTGSRLERDPNATSAAPISSVTAEEFIASGEVAIAEILRDIPALANSSVVSDSTERTSLGTFGQSLLDLRSLGTSRTLVLVNGRRHVSTSNGTQAVDIQTIPTMLIERVDVLTGGASSVYGADAVSGVVNFITKKNFEGLDLRSTVGISEEGDGRSFLVEGAWGKNFAGGRGNLVIGGSYDQTNGVLVDDRVAAQDRTTPFPGNPLAVFQFGDITASTPNFQKFYNLNRGIYPAGSSIPFSTAAFNQFVQQYTAAFGSAPVLTAAEQALLDRAKSAPIAVLLGDASNQQTSFGGRVRRADNQPFNLDLDGNGIPDCRQSFAGTSGFGCYDITPEGGVGIVQDPQLFGGGPLGFGGGSGLPLDAPGRSLTPDTRRYAVNLLGHYEFSPAAEVFGEFKYVRAESEIRDANSVSLGNVLIRPDNPFIPAALQAEAVAGGGLRINRDFNSDIGEVKRLRDIDVYRGVAGLRGRLSPNLSYELSGVYGRTNMNLTFTDSVIRDRFFAAVDAVKGPNGQPVCRSDINPAATPPGAVGFVTFNPGDGTCRPVNLFGFGSISREAAGFFSVPTTSRFQLEQLVLTGQVAGDTGGFFTLPGGPIRFAAGAEYRKEKSRAEHAPLARRILPVNSPAGAAGTVFPSNLLFIYNSVNLAGSYDVQEVFAEVELPLFKDRPLLEELSIGGAARFSHYSTVGATFTWSVNGIYSPVRDLKFRGTYAVAIRAPNVAELFAPETSAGFNGLVDPCDQAAIDNLIKANDPRAANRTKNCRAAGIPENFKDPTPNVQVVGVTSGNVNLQEEKARTFTAGAIVQPRFIPGSFASVDYYNIEIEEAVGSPGAQNILNLCYDGPTLDSGSCGLFTRAANNDITFLRNAAANFGRIETAGIDASIGYNFSLGEHQFGLKGTATWLDKFNNYFTAANLSTPNPQLGELGTPEWSGYGSVNYAYGPYSLAYRLQYVGRQATAGRQIEDRVAQFGPDGGWNKEKFIHDLSGSIEVSRDFTFYAGINNVTNEKPFSGNYSYPVSGVGRYLFVGARAKF